MYEVSYSNIKDIQIPTDFQPYMEHYESQIENEQNVWFYMFEIKHQNDSSILNPLNWFKGRYVIEITAYFPNKALNRIFTINRNLRNYRTLYSLITKLEGSGCQVTVKIHHKTIYDMVMGYEVPIK